MPAEYSEQLYRAIQALIFIGIGGFAYKTAREAAVEHGRWWSVSRSIGWCLGLAMFAAVVMGQPSCDEQGDPLHGSCDSYSDDGFDPSFDERAARFLFFSLVLGVPALWGAFTAPDWEIAKRQKEREDLLVSRRKED